jgi:V8-like Glu-specific endopeptidase
MLVVALVSAGPAQAAPSKANERAERARIVKYWTPARMAGATPRDFVKTKDGFVPVGRGGTNPNKRPSQPDDSGGTASTSVVTGAPWDGGGPALRSTGKVFFTMAGHDYVCSGATVDDGSRAGYSLVLTAGHCAYDEANRAFATNWMFAPEYDTAPNGCAGAPRGCFAAVALVVHAGYATAGGFNRQAIQHDWAFAVVGTGSKGGQLDDVAGFPVGFDAPDGERYSFGYPAGRPYSGRDLIYCSGPVISDSNYGTWGLACDMTGGSSGGPWMRDFSPTAKAGTLNSLNSYTNRKYRGYMFGPKFGTRTEDVYDRALNVTGNTTVG